MVNLVSLVVVHVDDIYATGAKDFLRRVRTVLSERFCMLNSECLKASISIKVERGHDGAFFLNQRSYIHHITEKHWSSPYCTAWAPCNTNFYNMKNDSESPPTTKPYSELIGVFSG